MLRSSSPPVTVSMNLFLADQGQLNWSENCNIENLPARFEHAFVLHLCRPRNRKRVLNPNET